MCLHIRAHFDGRNFVPDEPVDLPVNQSWDLEITPSGSTPTTSDQIPPVVEQREQLRKLDEFFRGEPLGEVPLDALRRENMYEDRS